MRTTRTLRAGLRLLKIARGDSAPETARHFVYAVLEHAIRICVAAELAGSVVVVGADRSGIAKAAHEAVTPDSDRERIARVAGKALDTRGPPAPSEAEQPEIGARIDTRAQVWRAVVPGQARSGTRHQKHEDDHRDCLGDPRHGATITPPL